MALVPHITDPKRPEVMKKINKLIDEGGPTNADQLLDEHNVKVGENDGKIVKPPEGVITKESGKTSGKTDK